jgi:hypothetical protein
VPTADAARLDVSFICDVPCGIVLRFVTKHVCRL